MQNRASASAKNKSAARSVRIGLSTIDKAISEWLLDCKIRQLSKKTLAMRLDTMTYMMNFFRSSEFIDVGVSEIKQFIGYLGIEKPGARRSVSWSKTMDKPLSSSSIKHHYGIVRTFFRWMENEEYIDASPFDVIKPGIWHDEQVQPFTRDELLTILEHAKLSRYPKRDTAVILFLLDTGVRAGELAALKMSDVDIEGRRGTVLGKGNKKREIGFSGLCAKALWRYLREHEREPDDALFVSEQSRTNLTVSGVGQIVRKVVKAAGINRAHIGPHTFRHTFAIEFLRNGGNGFTLQQRLGHTDLDMTRRYVSYAEADINRQARMYSPVDALMRPKR